MYSTATIDLMSLYMFLQVGTYCESRRAGPFAVEVNLCETSQYVTVREIFVSLLVIPILPIIMITIKNNKDDRRN